MKNWYFLDIETYQGDGKGNYTPILDANQFYYGCISNSNGQKTFHTTANGMLAHVREIIDKNKKRGMKSYFYAHNHLYDFIGYAGQHIHRLMGEQKLLIVRPKPLYAILDRYGYLLDTMSFFPGKLADIGETLGFTKLTMPEHISERSEITEYLERDVDITKEFMLKLKESINKLGYHPIKWTTAGQVAMNCWQQHLRKEGTEHTVFYKGVIHRKIDTFHYIRRANKGGRTEAFHIGEIPYAELHDINKHYLKTMHDLIFPDLRSEMTWTKESWEHLQEKNGVLTVTVTVPDIKIGILPLWVKIDKKHLTMYPHSGETITGTWTIREIAYALQHGYQLQKIHKGIYYLRNLDENPLKTYTEKIYSTYEKATGIMKHTLKLLGNSLYGKFGQYKNTNDWNYIQRWEVGAYLQSGWEVSASEDDYLVKKPQNEGYIPRYGNPSISTQIMAQARITLHKWMTTVHPDNVLYCDTDSIMLLKNGELLPHGGEWGAFKIEATGPAYIRGEKHYSIGEKVTIGGVPKKEHTPDILKKSTYTTSRMGGISRGFGTMGTMEPVTLHFKDEPKRSIKIPENYVEEYSK